MKSKIAVVFLYSFLFTVANAQEFIGYVKRYDSIPSAIFQAKVEVTENGKQHASLKTYFDGSYKFSTNRKSEYKVNVSYPGYTDTTFTVVTDKKGNPTPETSTVLLKKDGMRLLGTIKSKIDSFPIKGATIVLKNVMTQHEQRTTTGIDGYYNFKMEYETNYRVSIDKRSEGIVNRYKDTAFYLSTVGFNKPLDYRLDIILNPTDEKVFVPEEYNPSRAPLNKNIKPVVEVKPTDIALTEHKSNEVTGQKEEKTNPAAEKLEISDSLIISENALPVVMSNELKKMVGDSIGANKSVTQNTSAATSTKATPNEKEEPVAADPLHAMLAEQERLQKEIAAQQKRSDSLMKAAIQLRKKILDDSIQQVKLQQEALARKKAYEDSLKAAWEAKRKKEIADSLLAVKAEKERLQQEAFARKKYEDSVAQAAALIYKKFVEDSIKQAKLREQELARKKAYEDSLKAAWEAKRKKEIADSLQAVKEAERLSENSHITQSTVEPQSAIADSFIQTGIVIKQNTYTQPMEAKQQTHYAPSLGINKKEGLRPRVRYKILFAKNRAKLNIYTQEGLEKAIQFMKVNPTSEVKIYGNSGENEKNKSLLREQRVDVIVKTLLSNGIEIDRISIYSPEVEKLSYEIGSVGELLKQFRWTILEVYDY